MLIAGGGIAGLALAAHLERAGADYLPVEQAPSWERIGDAIGLWSRGIDMLDEVGVAEAARPRGTPLTTSRCAGAAARF